MSIYFIAISDDETAIQKFHRNIPFETESYKEVKYNFSKERYEFSFFCDDMTISFVEAVINDAEEKYQSIKIFFVTEDDSAIITNDKENICIEDAVKIEIFPDEDYFEEEDICSGVFVGDFLTTDKEKITNWLISELNICDFKKITELKSIMNIPDKYERFNQLEEFIKTFDFIEEAIVFQTFYV